MAPSVIELVEMFRANGMLFTDKGAFNVCRDAALEAGVWLSVKRCRAVPIKKSNQRMRWLAALAIQENASLFGIDASAYELWAAPPADRLASNPTLGAWYGQGFIEMPRWLWKSDAIFAELLHEEQRDAPRTIPDAQAMIGELLEHGYLIETTAGNGITVVGHPFVREGEAWLMSRAPSRSRVPAALINERLDGRRR